MKKPPEEPLRPQPPLRWADEPRKRPKQRDLVAASLIARPAGR